MVFIKKHRKNVGNFNYEWVLNELNKDNNIEGITRIGFTKDGYEVFIVTDDDLLSDEPHFHYRKKEKSKQCEFHACIKLGKAEYYHHNDKEDKLNKNQIENLIDFLNSKPLNGHFNNNYQKILFMWNTQNNNTKVDITSKIPPYSMLLKSSSRKKIL